MKSLLISLLGALAFSAAAQAAEPQTTPAAHGVPTTAQTEAKKAPVGDAHCLRHTGTRIVSRAEARADRKPRGCSSGAIGRAYTRDDLNRTGETTVADALRKLDPSIH